MSAAVLPAPARDPFARPGIGRLTAVELRKMADTRAGFWLLLVTVALSAALVVGAVLLLDPSDRSFDELVLIAAQPANILMPVVGILLVTSEWSQRTGLITFTLVPVRARVLVAKLLAGVALSLVAFAIGVVFAAIAVVIAPPAGGVSLSGWLVGQTVLSVVVSMLAGIGFGAVLLATAPAIVLYFLLPTAWAMLGSFSALEGAARWLDQTRTLAPMAEHALSAGEWARVGTSLALWLALPVLVGFWRVARGDVR